MEEAWVIRIRKNAVTVLVPKYGIEGPIHLKGSGEKNITADLVYDAQVPSLGVSIGGVSLEFKVFQRVLVEISVEESIMVQRTMRLRLVEPVLPGISVGSGDGSAAKKVKVMSKWKKQKNNANANKIKITKKSTERGLFKPKIKINKN